MLMKLSPGLEVRISPMNRPTLKKVKSGTTTNPKKMKLQTIRRWKILFKPHFTGRQLKDSRKTGSTIPENLMLTTTDRRKLHREMKVSCLWEGNLWMTWFRFKTVFSVFLSNSSRNSTTSIASSNLFWIRYQLTRYYGHCSKRLDRFLSAINILETV